MSANVAEFGSVIVARFGEPLNYFKFKRKEQTSLPRASKGKSRN